MKLRNSQFPLIYALALVVMPGGVAASPVYAAGAKAPAQISNAVVGAKSATVPFRLIDGHIVVDAVVNGKSATFVVDTGAGGDIVRPESMERLGIVAPRQEGKYEANGAGGSQKAQLVKVSSLAVGGMAIADDTAFAVSLPVVLEGDGLLGYGFLSHYVVTFDYTDKTLTICSPAAFVPPAVPALPITMSANVPTVAASVDGVSGSFQLDTGSGSGVTLTTPFVDRKRLRDRYPNRIETITGMGIGGALRADLVRIKEFTLGSTSVEGAIGELSRQKNGSFSDSRYDGNIGYEVLSRFTVTLDYPGLRAYFVPNDALKTPFTYNRSGIGITLNGERVVVGNVVRNSPADKAGVKDGDEIIADSGIPLNAGTLEQLRNHVRGAAGTSFTITVIHRGETAHTDLTITLRDLL